MRETDYSIRFISIVLYLHLIILIINIIHYIYFLLLLLLIVIIYEFIKYILVMYFDAFLSEPGYPMRFIFILIYLL